MLTLCCGTSTGAIMAGFILAGVKASDIKNFYCNDGVILFNEAKNLFLIPKFKRQLFQDKLDDILQNYSSYGKDVILHDLPDELMIAAYNLCSHRTHFIRSHRNSVKDENIRLRDAIAWSSLSAAYYFGAINAPDYEWTYHDNHNPHNEYTEHGAVFQDGGQGTQNCTLDFILTEILSQDLVKNDDEVIIISLGTGGHTKFDSYEKMSKSLNLDQIKRYILNQARDESTTLQVLAAEHVEKCRPTNIKLFRLDYESEKDYGLDDATAMGVAVYKDGADDIINSKQFEELVSILTS